MLYRVHLVFFAFFLSECRGRQITVQNISSATGDSKSLENFVFDLKFSIGSVSGKDLSNPIELSKTATPSPVQYVTDGDWTVVFKAQSLTGISPFEIYNSKGIRNEIRGSYPESCAALAKVPGCFTPYRTGLIDEWEKLDVQQVRFLIIINSDTCTKREVIFDGRLSTNTNWFTKERVLSSTWTDLTANQTYNLFSFNGIQDVRVNRHWSISHNFGGCPNDRAWFTTSFYPPTGCRFDKRKSAMPNFVVCPGTKMCNMQRESINADAFAIMIKAKNKLPEQ
ncbi:uncharacterized protein LOC125673562 [Ostrea edulis]|uniref:uncharacterized protein LOC125673562 n=1 Tax=Ostrea edulis TaxID=37623 RepID=UPI0024AFEB36|nr:uncharacterized protein LOC125673562 [Ostrea edulis]